VIGPPVRLFVSPMLATRRSPQHAGAPNTQEPPTRRSLYRLAPTGQSLPISRQYPGATDPRNSSELHVAQLISPYCIHRYSYAFITHQSIFSEPVVERHNGLCQSLLGSPAPRVRPRRPLEQRRGAPRRRTAEVHLEGVERGAPEGCVCVVSRDRASFCDSRKEQYRGIRPETGSSNAER
jgi:hypothetical protein